MLTVKQMKELLTNFPDNATIEVGGQDIKKEGVSLETFFDKNNKQINQILHFELEYPRW